MKYISIIIFAVFFASCTTTSKSAKQKEIDIGKYPWIENIPTSDEYLYFVGVSDMYTEEADAKHSSLIDAFFYISSYISNGLKYNQKSSIIGSGMGISRSIDRYEIIKVKSSSIIKEAKIIKTAVFKNDSGYICYSLVSIPKETIYKLLNAK